MNPACFDLRSFGSIVLIFALITPCIPKIGISEQITVYPSEICLLLSFPFLLFSRKFEVQKDLYVLWGVILLSTILSQLFMQNLGSILRCIKELVYIPIVYLAYKSKWLKWNHISYFFILSSIINLSYIAVSGFTVSSLNIWDTDTMFSGLSNKYFDLRSLSIVHLEGKGSHNIYSDYCSIALCSTIFAYKRKQVNRKILITVSLLALTCVGMSVSREGLIVMGSMLLFYYFARFKYQKISLLQITALILIILCIVVIVIYFGDRIAIVQKILYTQKSISDTGQESNIALRIGAWKVYFESILNYPHMLLIGYGYNFEYYQSYLTFHTSNAFVAIPESLFVECVMCGGLISLLFGIKFWISIFIIIDKVKRSSNRYALKGLFCGLLFGSIFSGAAVFSDLLYGQILLLLGMILRETTNDDLKGKIGNIIILKHIRKLL